jgi:hypothetical protein
MNKELIESRESLLSDTKKYLKSQFIGIDEIIDKFIDSVRIWYLMPEAMTRPLIINLWGITGVGKTDLVRKFVSYIGMPDKFCEIQLNSQDGNATIQDYLEMVLEDETQQGVLLLDEIQRFRSVDEEGMEKNSSKFQDLWMLLSDGTFESNSKMKNDLLGMVLDEEFWDERKERSGDDKKEHNHKYNTSYWMARRLKKLLRSADSVESIMAWDNDTRMKKVKERLTASDAFTGTKYKKLLIIVSGNLDEAFQMSGSVDDADLDADVYHEYSKNVDIVTIKRALTNRFKPEQIARFGNIHLVYPILNKSSYYALIKQKCDNILDNIKNDLSITIKLDDSVYDVIYQNGVFPTQGVRPVLSTISAILENAIPTFVFKYIKSECKNEDIDIKYANGKLTSEICGELVYHQIPTVLDDIKNKKTNDYKALVATHEAGHAVVYSIIRKLAPTQVVANTSNLQMGGFVGKHPHLGSKEDIINEIVVTMGGRAAEQLIFGAQMINWGGSSDYQHATELAANMIRIYGMSERTQSRYEAVQSNRGGALVSIENTDHEIESILSKCYETAESMLQKNMKFLLDVAGTLMEKNNISPENFKIMFEGYVPGMQVLEASEKYEAKYFEKLNEFLKK